MMGGGYDVAEETNGRRDGTPAGDRVYFINGRIGAVAHSSSRRTTRLPPTSRWSTSTGDGIPDRAYAVDVRGNVYRIDLPTSGDVPFPTTWSGTPP